MEKPTNTTKIPLIRRIKLSFLSGFLFIVIIAVMFSHSSFEQKGKTSSPPPSQETLQQDVVNYAGRAGVDALTLLKEIGTVEQDRSGLVVSINGRKADSQKKEFWSFYVNGEMAPVGPADYQTKDTDTIEWKIQNY